MIVTIPARFFYDHQSRDLPTGRVTGATSKLVQVDVTPDELAEWRSDAEHYATPGNFTDPDLRGLVASARATLRRLQPHST